MTGISPHLRALRLRTAVFFWRQGVVWALALALLALAGSLLVANRYLMLLMLVAGITTLAGYSLEFGASSHRREAERELLQIGAEFERALVSYARSGPQNDPILAGPSSLDKLLKDDRAPQALRHLRKMYKDPMTGGTTWGTVRGPSGAIWGVYSLASGKPLQQKNLPSSLAQLDEAESYADWVFGLPQARSPQRPGADPATSNGRSLTLPFPPANNPTLGAPS